MNVNDFDKFSEQMTLTHELYGKSMSAGLVAMWFEAFQAYSIEEFCKAMKAHVMDVDKGTFAPKIADIMRNIKGSKGDNAQIAWSKAYAAMSSVGAYQDVVFDDAIVHAVIADLGGWVKLCRMDEKDLSYTQHRFCELYKGYKNRGAFDYPSVLLGLSNSNGDNAAMLQKRGLKAIPPVYIGNAERCDLVFSGGGDMLTNSKTAYQLASEVIAAACDRPAKRIA